MDREKNHRAPFVPPRVSRESVQAHAQEARAGHLLRLAYHRAREYARDNLGEYDITVRQSAALQAIAQHGQLSQAELGHAIGMEPANVHGLVARLQKKGLINAARDPAHSKRMRVGLTKAGRRTIKSLQSIAIDAERDTMSKLTPDEQEQFLALLRKIVT